MQQSEPTLPRTLGSIDATCVVIGAIVGVGIFFTPSSVAQLCPSSNLALLAWGIGGLIALCGALAFAELGGMYHGSGAVYAIIRDCYGSYAGFIFVFCMTTIIVPSAAGVMAVICATNILAFFDKSAEPQIAIPMAIGFVVLLAVANMLGAKWGTRIGNITVYARVGTLIAIAGLAVLLAPDQQAIATEAALTTDSEPPRHAVLAVLSALVPIMFAYGGWQQVLWMAGEVRDPGRILPRATIIGVLIVIAVYLLANWAYLRLLGVQGVAESKALGADAVGVVWPEFGRKIAALAVAISAFGVLNVNLLTAPRLMLGMAQDGRFFNVFSRVNVRFGTPIPAIGLISLISILMLYATRHDAVNQLVSAAVIVDSVFFVLIGAAVLVLRSKRPTAERPMRVPLYPIVPLLFVLGEVGAIVGGYMNPETKNLAFGLAVWIALASIVYAIVMPRPYDV